MTTTPPGWYDDGFGALRWWDGAQWTEHVATPDAEAVEGIVAGERADVDAMTGRQADGAAMPYRGGYPAAYPGAEGGAFVSATEPHKSRRWIVWVVLGAILLAVVITLAVVIPIGFLRATGGGTPQPTVYGEGEQQQAAEAVALYDQAYQTADCDAYFAATTESFRALFKITDCDSFLEQAAQFDTAYDDYDVTVNSIAQNDAGLSVFTTETYVSAYDDDGNETAEPQTYTDDYEYIVVPLEGGWAIDDAFPYDVSESAVRPRNARFVLTCIGVGLLAGLMSGLFGVGGGTVIVPLLVLILGFDQRLAAGTSLAAIVPTATVGVISYAVHDSVAWIPALILAVGAVGGAQLGTWLLPRLPLTALRWAFVGFLVIVIVSLFIVVPSRDAELPLTPIVIGGLILLGVITGTLAGILGVGGGIIVVPALMLLFGTSDLLAKGTSLLMMIPTAVSGTIGNIRRRNVDLVAAALVGAAACTTTALGAWIATLVDPLTGNVLFAVFLTVIAGQMALRALRGQRR